MSKYKMDGYREEPIEDKHWRNDSIKEKLRAHLTAKYGGLSGLDLGTVDLRPFCSPVHDQRNLGSCVAQSVVKALEIKRIQKYGRENHVDLSVLGLYYLSRELMDPPETHLDDGTRISLACDALRRWGICEEARWPYSTGKYHVAPPWKAMRRGYVNRIDAFHRIVSHGSDRVTDVLIHLHAGNPVVFGTSLTKSFWDTDKDTVVGPTNGVVKGRHAMVIVGYLADRGVFVVENSWSRSWGDEGYFYASPEFVADPFMRDVWVITGGWEDWA